MPIYMNQKSSSSHTRLLKYHLHRFGSLLRQEKETSNSKTLSYAEIETARGGLRDARVAALAEAPDVDGEHVIEPETNAIHGTIPIPLLNFLAVPVQVR